MPYYTGRDAPAPHAPDYPSATLVASGSDFGVIVSIMCVCGNNDCAFTANSYPNEMVFVPDWRTVEADEPSLKMGGPR
jgi:hypothetical protein